MLGRFLVVAITGLVVWKYRDSLREYAKGNSGPAREKVDGLLRTVQNTSEALLDQAKEQLSSRLGSARERVRASGSEAREEDRQRSSDSVPSLSRAGSVRFEGK
jgi:endo-alpha-1,4-polygalactosaminidase (GH114 family)